MKKSLLGAACALSLACLAAAPAVAADTQKFWVINFSHFDIYNVYALQDRERGSRDLLGDNGHLDFDPAKVPDEVLVLRPHKGRGCYSDVKIVGYYPDDADGTDPFVAVFRSMNICTPGLTINVSDGDFR